MRRGIWAGALLLLVVSALGGEVRLDAPVSSPHVVELAGTLRVVVTGISEESGMATLLVLRTGVAVQVPLKRVGDRLESEGVHVQRPCDVAGAPAVAVELGDTIVVATEAGGGRCALVRVGPRASGARTLTVERRKGETMVWEKAASVAPGLFRVTLRDPSLDTTCAQEVVLVVLTVGTKAATLCLTEDAPASGRFVGEFAVEVRPDGSNLNLRVVDGDKKVLVEIGAVDGTPVRLERDNLSVEVPVALLPVQLSSTEVTLPLPCQGELRVVRPEKPDEVQWFVDAALQHAQGRVLPLYPDGPRTLRVVVLVRDGVQWGRAEATVDFVPPVKVSFVAFDTGETVDGLWPYRGVLRVKAEHVRGELKGIMIGRLGPDPRTCELPLEDVGGGVFLSVPFRPSDFGFCGGDVLWAQHVDPRGCESTYVVLPLR